MSLHVMTPLSMLSEGWGYVVTLCASSFKSLDALDDWCSLETSMRRVPSDSFLVSFSFPK